MLVQNRLLIEDFWTSATRRIGSGFIINEEGHILTNYHVVEGAQTVKIIFYDGTETDGKVINTMN